MMYYYIQVAIDFFFFVNSKIVHNAYTQLSNKNIIIYDSQQYKPSLYKQAHGGWRIIRARPQFRSVNRGSGQGTHPLLQLSGRELKMRCLGIIRVAATASRKRIIIKHRITCAYAYTYYYSTKYIYCNSPYSVYNVMCRNQAIHWSRKLMILPLASSPMVPLKTLKLSNVSCPCVLR